MAKASKRRFIVGGGVISFGIVSTLAYFAGVWLTSDLTLETIGAMTPNEAGDFWGGIFGPPALFWFIVAFLAQRAELTNNSAATRQQAEATLQAVTESQAQTIALQGAKKYTKRDVLLRTVELHREALAGAASNLYFEILGTDAKAEDLLWGRFAHGDKDIFFHLLLDWLHGGADKPADRLTRAIREKPKLGPLTVRFRRLALLFRRDLSAMDETGAIRDLVELTELRVLEECIAQAVAKADLDEAKAFR